MSKILVKSNTFGGVSYMIDPRQRGGPSFMDLARRVGSTTGAQRMGALAGLAGKIGAGVVAANQAAYGLQAGNLSAPFGAMDQYAALDPTRGMKLNDAENERRMQEQAAEQVTQERMRREAQRQAEIAAQPQAQPVQQIPLPTLIQQPAAGQQGTLFGGPPVDIPSQQAPMQSPAEAPPDYVAPETQQIGSALAGVQQPLPFNATQNTAGVIQESAHPQHHENTEEDLQRLGRVVGQAQNSQKNASYVDMVYDEMGDIFHKQTAEDVANAITFTFLKHRR